MILAAEAAGGSAALITAVGGIIVSLSTVWFNAKKQSNKTSENTGTIGALTEQIASLANEVSKYRAENSSLKTELQILKSQLEITDAKAKAIADNVIATEPTPKPKKAKKKTK